MGICPKRRYGWIFFGFPDIFCYHIPDEERSRIAVALIAHGPFLGRMGFWRRPGQCGGSGTVRRPVFGERPLRDRRGNETDHVFPAAARGQRSRRGRGRKNRGRLPWARDGFCRTSFFPVGQGDGGSAFRVPIRRIPFLIALRREHKNSGLG